MSLFQRILRRRQIEDDIAEEIRQHLQERTDELLESGLSLEAARAAARREFGNVALMEERSREVWRWTAVETLLSDIRHVIRRLRKAPAFTLTSILTLAVGIGANLAALAIARTIFWQPVAVPHPEQLLSIYSRSRSGPGSYTGIAYNEFLYYHDHNDVLSALAGYWRIALPVRIGNVTESIPGELVTPDFFSALPAHTVLGRTLSTAHNPGSGPQEIVLSARLWKDRFGESPSVLGKTVEIAGYPYIVAGVVAAEFSSVLMDWVDTPQFWIPMEAIRHTPFSNLISNWKANSMMVVGRMKPDVTLAQAEGELLALDTRLSADEPERLRAWNGEYDFRMTVLPAQQARFFPAYRESILNNVEVVAVIMAMLLIIACLNLVNLVIARGAAQQREWAIRATLGAGRIRLFRQSAIEALLLCAAGGAGAFLIAESVWHALPLYGRPFRVVLPERFPLDPYMLLACLGLVLITAMTFGLWPARRAARMDLNAALKRQYQAERFAGLRVRSLLIAAQVAISIVLLVGAGLFVRTVHNARAVSRLDELDHVGVIAIDYSGAGEPDKEKGGVLLEQLLARVQSIGGIESAGYGVSLTGGKLFQNVECSDGADMKKVAVDLKLATPGYHQAFGTPVLSGRDFTDHDTSGSPDVAIVNESLARNCWPGRNPVGMPLRVGKDTVEIIGVVKDTRGNFRSAETPLVSLPFFQDKRSYATLYVRTAAPPLTLFPDIRRIAAELNPDGIIKAQTAAEQIDAALSQERLVANLCVALGTVALGLTVIGLYGMIMLSVTARTKEIGIRMAIGACSKDVVDLVLKQSVLVLAAGIGVGGVASAALARSVRSMLFGVAPLDALSFGLAAFLLVAAASVAAFIPARRASRIDPWVALRNE